MSTYILTITHSSLKLPSLKQSECACPTKGQTVQIWIRVVVVVVVVESFMIHHQSRKPPICPTGPRTNFGGGVSATGFLGILGISGGFSINLSVPNASARNFSLRGLQVSLSGSITPLAGLGLFLGAGHSYSAGGSNEALNNLSASYTPVIQAGAGNGGGVEVSTDFSSPLSGSASMGRIAGGAYGAAGLRVSGTLASNPLGCR